MTVNIRTCLGAFGSLPYCAKILSSILSNFGFTVKVSNKYEPECVNVLVDETISSILNDRKAEIWWTDTPGMLPLSYHNLQSHIENELFLHHFVTSQFMVDHCKELNIPVDDYIYRPINPVLFSFNTDFDKCKYDLCTIGKFCICDRKRIALQRNIVMKHKFSYCAVTDAWLPSRPYITKYNFGSIDDLKKAKILSSSKFLLWTSFVEGFGMPVLEAMACGCVPIYTDCPAHNEFAEGIKIPTSGKSKGFCYGTRVVKYDVDEKDVEETVLYALSLSREEYVDLSIKCKEKAEKIYTNTINDVSRKLVPLIDRLLSQGGSTILSRTEAV